MNSQTSTRVVPSATQHFVGALSSLHRKAENGHGPSRAILARLRRTLTGRTLSFDGMREIGDILSAEIHESQLETYLLIAALFAHNPSAVSSGSSLGGTLRSLRGQLSAGAESLDRRFSAVLDAQAEELPYRLRQLNQLLKSKNVSPNYFRLLDDLLYWDHPSRFVQRRWAKEYWVG
ncbi:MAG: type I-E CRISPR-associated protein Cse2/CasB [Bacteroidota bacterium]